MVVTMGSRQRHGIVREFRRACSCMPKRLRGSQMLAMSIDYLRGALPHNENGDSTSIPQAGACPSKLGLATKAGVRDQITFNTTTQRWETSSYNCVGIGARDIVDSLNTLNYKP
jgi:hypothetical protein